MKYLLVTTRTICTIIAITATAIALTVSTPALAKTQSKAPAPIHIKDKVIEKCVADGLQMQIGDKANLSKLCTCTINVQANNLTLGEYWQIQSAAINGATPQSVKPLMRIQSKLDACGKGLSLNIPKPNAK